jgi:hypothetical protein
MQKGVLLERNSDQMRRVHTTLVAALMVDMEPRRNRTDQILIEPPVRADVDSADPEAGVPVDRELAPPIPATRRLIYLVATSDLRKIRVPRQKPRRTSRDVSPTPAFALRPRELVSSEVLRTLTTRGDQRLLPTTARTQDPRRVPRLPHSTLATTKAVSVHEAHRFATNPALRRSARTGDLGELTAATLTQMIRNLRWPTHTQSVSRCTAAMYRFRETNLSDRGLRACPRQPPWRFHAKPATGGTGSSLPRRLGRV